MKKNRTSRLGLNTALLLGGAALAALLSAPAMAADVTETRLENADSEPHNWLMGFQNYSSHRYSRLSQINQANIGNLKVAFTVSLNTGLTGRTTTNLMNYPLVDDGFMYLDDGIGGFSKADVRSGTRATILWRADAAVARDLNSRSRGMAMMNNALYHNLADGRVVAIDRDSGEFIWDRQVAKVPHPKAQTTVGVETETFTAAPIAAAGRLFVANSGGDAGSRGWLSSLDAATGEEQWRTYVVPGPGEPGHETWKDDNGAWMTGGAGMWTTGSYDPEQRVTIWGTGQPQPMFDPEFRPGDNLYSNSAIAFNIEDGAIKWYFQYTANESWDYDEQGVHMLIDAEVDGEMRKQVVHFGRNGYYYQLDRTNGQFIKASQYVAEVNWTAGIDPKTGKPVEYDPSLDVQQYIPETRHLRGDTNNAPACPHVLGGVRWQPPAYNPRTGIIYSVGVDGCATWELIPVIALEGGGIDRAGPGGPYGAFFGANTTITDVDVHGLIVALNAATGEKLASLRQPYMNNSGILATAGGLLFSGTLDGAVTAHDDQTLTELWRFDTGISVKGPPMSYSVGGKQFIGVIAGGNPPGGVTYPELALMPPGAMLFVFSL